MRVRLLKKDKCDGCGLCAKMRIVNGKAKFGYAACIRCFYGVEHCPRGAVTIRRRLLMGTAEKLERLVRKLASR